MMNCNKTEQDRILYYHGAYPFFGMADNKGDLRTITPFRKRWDDAGKRTLPIRTIAERLFLFQKSQFKNIFKCINEQLRCSFACEFETTV